MSGALALTALQTGAWGARAGASAVGPRLLRRGLDARLVVQVRPEHGGAGARRRHRHHEGSWRASGSGWVRELDGDGFRAVLRATPAPNGLVLDAEIHYLTRVRVTREAIDLTLPGRARVLDRSLDIAALDRPLRIDRGTPVWIATRPRRRRAGVAVVADSGIPAAVYWPRRRTTAVQLVIDDAGVHPFTAFARCRAHYLPPPIPGMPRSHRPPAALERRVRHDHIERAAGQVVDARAELYFIRPGRIFRPLIVERWPNGARAAVVFTDHADRTDPEALRAVLYGVSDQQAPGYGRGGFFGHHLRITKTFFARPGIGSLADPAARALAGEIVAAGSEVGAHSITPNRDPRAVVARTLSLFAPWKVVTWIDHQPDTNCEAIASRGWSNDRRFGIHDLLAAAGFSWVWSDTDLPERGVRIINLFEPRRRLAALPPIYPLPSDPRLWAFDSSWFYDRPARLAAALSNRALERLESQRGLFVAHTYLSASPRTTRWREHIACDVVKPRPGGGFLLDPVFDAALARLGAQVSRGAIASLTLRESGDRLRALGDVVVRYRPDGTAVVNNAGRRALRGLTVAVPGSVDLSVRGAQVRGRRHDPDRSEIWFDLPAHASAVVRARRRGGDVALGPGAAGRSR